VEAVVDNHDGWLPLLVVAPVGEYAAVRVAGLAL